jgi:hypothetical protein
LNQNFFFFADQDEYINEWQTVDKVSSSLSVITLPEFSTKQYQATDTKRKLETQDIQTCSNHSSYTDVRTNQETGSQENWMKTLYLLSAIH